MAILVVMTATAKSEDRLVYVVFPPWLAREDVQHRIAASGGHAMIDSLPFASKVVVSDRSTLGRLYTLGAALVLTATPVRLCTSGGGAAQ